MWGVYSPGLVTTRPSSQAMPAEGRLWQIHLEPSMSDLWDFGLWDIWPEWWENMTWPTKKTMRKTMTMANTFREHSQRGIFEDILNTPHTPHATFLYKRETTLLHQFSSSSHSNNTITSSSGLPSPLFPLFLTFQPYTKMQHIFQPNPRKDNVIVKILLWIL